MVYRNIYDIEIPKYIWKPSLPIKNAKLNMAFDTETEEGFVRLLADSNGRKIYLKGLKEYLEFLNHSSYRNTVNWFYNLEYDTNSLLKFLNIDQRKKIVFNNTIDIDGYRISMIPKKELTISELKEGDYNKDGTLKIHHSTYFYDLAQFYDYTALKKLASQVNMKKVEVEDIQNINWNKYVTDAKYNKLINSRCVVDCEITKALADKLTKEINKLVIVNKYKSKATIARKYVLEHLKKQLSLPDYGLLQSALSSYHAGHIETCKMGIFENIQNYDLNSAYPSVMANIYETNGSYRRNRDYEPNAAYSYYEVVVHYENKYMSPLWFAKGNNNYHATGQFDTWVTKSEYEFLISKDYDVVIKSAYHLIKTSDSTKPFYNIIHDLYERRLQAKREGDQIEKVIKVILNSMYGVTINTVLKYETTEDDTDIWILNAYDEIVNYKKTFKATNMYNPLFATEITARTRTTLFNDFWKYLKYVTSVNTDGVYLTKKVKGLDINKELGGYSIDKIDKYMLLGSGRYLFINPDNTIDDKQSKFRSVPISAQQMYGMMDVHRDQEKLEIIREKPIKLKESLKNSNYYNLTFSKFPVQEYNEKDLFNVFRSVSKQITFYENRRKWFDSFETIQDIFDNQIESRPFKINELS